MDASLNAGSRRAGSDGVGELVMPDYRGANVVNVVPALLEHRALGDGWVPDQALEARQVVLLVVDGLGWNQLQARLDLAPTLAAAVGGPITTVAPSTTAAALTSITTGSPPGEHGIVGYKIRRHGELLNVLRWSTKSGDARQSIVPGDMQQLPAFGGREPVVVNRREFAESGFTKAHLMPVRYRPYGVVSTMIHETAEAAAAGESFVYAYYDGLDRVGHETGHGAAFDAEYRFVDWMVAELRRSLPSEVALLVTADHGQIDSTDGSVAIADDVLAATVGLSGEDRFVWLHGQRGGASELLAAATAKHGDDAWVLPLEGVLDHQLLGARVTPESLDCLGDVAMLARSNIALVDPALPPKSLIGRHGSLTADEMFVPLLAIES